MPNQQSLTEYVTRLSQLEKENRAIKAQLDQKFGCFKCGDGATPLYCLNCARDEFVDSKVMEENSRLKKAVVEIEFVKNGLRFYKSLLRRAGSALGDYPCYCISDREVCERCLVTSAIKEILK